MLGPQGVKNQNETPTTFSQHGQVSNLFYKREQNSKLCDKCAGSEQFRSRATCAARADGEERIPSEIFRMN